MVPDLRGIGKSSKPEGGYDKKTQAKDIRAVVTTLGYDKTFVVAHDIGNMVAYAYAATYPDMVERLGAMDAPIPGIEPWKEILLNPGVWHFNFHGPDAERLVAGRERIYFDRIWNDFTGDPSKPGEATRNFYCRNPRTVQAYMRSMEAGRRSCSSATEPSYVLAKPLACGRRVTMKGLRSKLIACARQCALQPFDVHTRCKTTVDTRSRQRCETCWGRSSFGLLS